MKNACIVGFGAIAPNHAGAIKTLKSANLYAVCDIVKERADKAAEEYGAKAYYDFDECLLDENIDVFHICTPHYLHFEMICKVLKTGRRVVVEKPATMTKEQFDILFREYDVTKIFPIIQNRTNNCAKELKRIVTEETKYGKLLGVKGFITWLRDKDYYLSEDWRGTKKYEGGGVLINQAVHTLDLLTLFAGDVESVDATMTNHSLKGIIDVEDTVDARIKFKNGAIGILYATNSYYTNTSVQIEVDFEHKHFRYVDGLLTSDGEVLMKDSESYQGKSYWGGGHAKTLSDLYEAEKYLTLEDVKNTMNTMFAIYESAEKGEEIKL